MYWSITFIPLLPTYAEFGMRTLVGGVNYANCLSWRSCGESPPIGYAKDEPTVSTVTVKRPDEK